MYESTRMIFPQFSVSRNGGKTNTVYVIPMLTLIARKTVALGNCKILLLQIGEVIVMSTAFSYSWKQHKFFFFS